MTQENAVKKRIFSFDLDMSVLQENGRTGALDPTGE